MSAVTTRPRVNQVELALNEVTPAVPAIPRATLERMAGTLSKAGQQVFDAVMLDAPSTGQGQSLVATEGLINRFQAICAETREVLAQQPAAHALPEAEAIRIETLVALGQSAFQATSTSHLQDSLLAMTTAETRAQVNATRTELTSQLGATHQRVFLNTLSTACQRAGAALGYTTVETTLSANGSVQLVARDEAGRGLVSEIQTGKTGTSIATEIVGVHDGSCQGILDAFDAALEAEGVRSVAPERTTTGGICELSTAKAFLKQTLNPGRFNAFPKKDSTKKKKGRRRAKKATTQVSRT